MDVSLRAIYQAFNRVDDGDGKLDNQEIARAALWANARGDNLLAAFFGTLVRGGQDRQGLKPDLNNDGKVSHYELARLAEKDGDTEHVSREDFRRMFPGRTVEGGNNITLNELRRIALTPPNLGDGNNLIRLLTSLVVVRLFMGGHTGPFGMTGPVLGLLLGGLLNRNNG